VARLSYQEVAIANGASLSGEVDLRNHRLVAIDMPATWTAAAITFAGAAAPDGARAATSPEPFDPVKDSGGTEVSITTAQATYVVLTEAHRQALGGLARCKVRSGTAGAAVNQGQAVILTLVLEPRDSNT